MINLSDAEVDYHRREVIIGIPSDMIVLTVLLVVIFLFLSWILFTPVLLHLDTDAGRYEVEQPATFSLRLFPDDNFRFDLKILEMRINLSARKSKRDVAKGKKDRKIESSLSSRTILKALSRISVRRFVINVDTGDVVTNAQFVPVAMFASRGPVDIRINFSGRVRADILISVVPFKLVWNLFVVNSK